LTHILYARHRTHIFHPRFSFIYISSNHFKNNFHSRSWPTCVVEHTDSREWTVYPFSCLL
jgi:hypothetical protein